MSKVKMAINGFGRIGRNVFKIAMERDDIEVIGINDLTDNKTLAHLLKYDSTQGKFNGTVEYSDDGITVNGKFIKIDAQRNPKDIDWGGEPDVVIESTGVFRTRDGERGGYGDHLKNGAKKVILTVPAKDKIDNMIVLGVNDEKLKPEDKCVSNASCAVSQIPTTTGAAIAVGKVLPELDGKMHGMAVRVPTPTGSMVDLVANLKKEVTREEVNAAMKEAAEGEMKGILEYCEDPIVSVDIIHSSYSSIFDSICTMVDGKTVKVISWYDNEWGYSTRVVDLAEKLFQ